MEQNEEKNERTEEKRHLTSAERQQLYAARAAAGLRAGSTRKKRKRILLWTAAVLGVLVLAGTAVGLFFLNRNVWKPERTYRQAEDLCAAEKYMEAYAVFLSLGTYRDAQDRAGDCILLNARKLTGRSDNVIATTKEMPWFSLDEAGALHFDKDKYRGDGTLAIPDILDGQAVLAIGDKCFFYADTLTAIQVPATVLSVGERAFFRCTALKELTLPDSVTSVATRAFMECTALERLTLSKNITAIADRAFAGCSSLRELILPDGLSVIESRLCNNCAALETLTLPAAAETVGNYAFTGCDSLRTVRYAGTRQQLEALCAGAEDAEILLAADLKTAE